MKSISSIRSVFALFLAAMLVFLAISTAFAASSSEIKSQLNELKDRNREIQSEIDAIQAKYDANASEIQQLVDKKNAIDQEIALLHGQILNYNDQIRAYGQMIADSQEHLDECQIHLNQLNEKHKDRIRAMEEQGTLTYWQVIFESNTFTQLLDRLDMVNEIAEADEKRMEEMRVAAEDLQTTQAQLQEDLDGLGITQQELADTESDLEVRRTESDDVLRQLVARQAEFQELLDESEAKQDALMREIAQKQKELQAAQYQEELVKLALKGQNPPSNATWIVPVSGYTITSAFGMRTHPVYGTTLMHNGVDLACQQGTPIYASRGGTVTTASYQEGGAGYYVSINHGDGFASIYMHMTHYVVSAGQKVSQGQLIGYVGSTGVSTGPHLHFGVSYGGTYVNPMAYI